MNYFVLFHPNLLILCLLGEVEFGVEILWAFFRRVNHTYTKFHIIFKKSKYDFLRFHATGGGRKSASASPSL
jgi:hypothetical protein